MPPASGQFSANIAKPAILHYMPTMNVSLTDYLVHFVQQRVASGRYNNASEVVRESLRLLERREAEEAAKLERLRAEAQEGLDALDRGDYTVLHSDQEVDDLISSVGNEVDAAHLPTRS